MTSNRLESFPAAQRTSAQLIDRRIQLVCAWCGPAAMLLGLAGFLMAGILPSPPAADATLAATVAEYAEHPVLVRLGLALASFALSLVGPLIALITIGMVRMERGRQPTLSILQAVAGAVTWIMLIVPIMMMNVAAFRPERSAELTQTLTDLAWILFLTPAAPFLIQNFAIGTAVLCDPRPEPLLPRWIAYANFWVGLAFLPALLAYFFKSGPFAWQGIFVFYLTVGAYIAWVLLMSWALRRAILQRRSP